MPINLLLNLQNVYQTILRIILPSIVRLCHLGGLVKRDSPISPCCGIAYIYTGQSKNKRYKFHIQVPFSVLQSVHLDPNIPIVVFLGILIGPAGYSYESPICG